MKHLLLTLFVFTICFSLRAQNYQCLQTGVKHYFTNSNGYLRGIRIDSVKTLTDSTIYYPYHTPRGYYTPRVSETLLVSNGGSWLGKNVVQRNDGTFLFDNLWNDSVVIKTQANIGDTWIFYRDTTTLYYKANLISADTMTVLGIVDSIKTILITAHNPMGIVAGDPVDSFNIILSKNNGFVQVFDLYTFPYHAPDSTYRQGLDYFLDLLISTSLPTPFSSNSIFSLVPFINPTSQQLYNFNVGDVSEYSACNDPDVSFYCTDISYGFDSITTKYTTGADIMYHFAGSLNSFDPLASFYSLDSGYNTLTFGNSLLIDTFYMPEEINQEQTYYYLPKLDEPEPNRKNV